MTRPTAAEPAVFRGRRSILVAGARNRGGAVVPRHSSESNEAESGAESCEDQKSLFIFGVGYVATAVALTFRRLGWTVHGTCTDPRKVKSLGEQGIKAYIFDDWSGPMMQPEPLDALASANCVLSTVPPSLPSGKDPVLAAHAADLQWAHSQGALRWVGYLSSTGVYGDRGGGWVAEEDEPWPSAPRTKARLRAERSWLRLYEKDDLPVHIFRLAGIYGPGRSALDAVARHNGDIRLAGSDDGTMVSRIHAADIVGVVRASVERPDPGCILNVADDLPSTRYETLAYACSLMGYPRQDPDPAEKFANRRGGGNKRVDNSKMTALLEASGRSLIFPDYRAGLRALHSGDGRPFAHGSQGGTEGLGSGTEQDWAGTLIGTSSEAEIKAGLREVTTRLSRLEESLDRVLTVLEAGVGRGSGGEAPADEGRGAPCGAGAGTLSGVTDDGGAAADANDVAALDPSPPSHSPQEESPEASLQPGGQPGGESDSSGSGFNAEEAIAGEDFRDGPVEHNGDSNPNRGARGSAEDAVSVGCESGAPSMDGVDTA